MITLSKILLTKIEHYGTSCYPNECVGALIGNVNTGRMVWEVERVFPINNQTEADRKRRYLVSPLDYLSAEKAADEVNETLLGFYHSHPEHPAVPSSTDLDWAQPNFIYLIVSVCRSSDHIVNAVDSGVFLLDEDRKKFLSQEVRVK